MSRGKSQVKLVKSPSLLRTGSFTGSVSADRDLEAPAADDETFDAYLTRFYMYEQQMFELVALVEFHQNALKQAFEDGGAMSEAALRIGSHEMHNRVASSLVWSNMDAARERARDLALDVEASLLGPIRGDMLRLAEIRKRVDARRKTEKDFKHYTTKLAELKANPKTDPAKLQRNEIKYEETALDLETETARLTTDFCALEKRRQELLSQHFVEWQAIQKRHFDEISMALSDRSEDVTLAAQHCLIPNMSKEELKMEGKTITSGGGSRWNILSRKSSVEYDSMADNTFMILKSCWTAWSRRHPPL